LALLRLRRNTGAAGSVEDEFSLLHESKTNVEGQYRN